MKKLFIISQTQFGYLIDFYQYTNNLKNDFEIVFLSWDYNKQYVELEKVKNVYISRKGSLLLRNLRFLFSTINQIRKNKFDIIFVNHFFGCFVLPLIKKKQTKIILDIRTASVSPSKYKRWGSDKILLFESLFYKNISVISEGVRKRLQLKKSVHILPLGANETCVNRVELDGLNLLYVGTFNNRNIHESIIGLSLFHEKFPEVKISYKIIGEGDDKYESKIKEAIDQYNLNSIVSLLGYIPNDKLEPYFYESNIGVSYVPITDYYFFQPPTKTYEYLMSGMPVIATKTFSNCEIINGANGVLIEDTPMDFSNGIESMMKQAYDPKKILNTVVNNKWDNITSILSHQIITGE